MKKIFIILFYLSTISINATTYYVSPKGNDSNDGLSISTPWLTWTKATNMAYAGDTVYFRGGTYALTYSVGMKRSGMKNDPICFFAYPDDYAVGKYPIFDAQTKIRSGTSNVGLSISVYNYIHVKGMIICNVKEYFSTDAAIGINCQNNKGITLENMTVHHTGGHGFLTYESDSIYYKNCDSHNNVDTLQTGYEGGTSDGFQAWCAADRNYHVFYYGCRAWDNGDDGFDTGWTDYVKWDNCWSWGNGKMKGDGNGFKFGFIMADPDSCRYIKNCLSAYNRAVGFHENSDTYSRMNMWVFNCTAYRNNYGFRSTTPKYFLDNQNIYKNNIAYANASYNYREEVAAFDAYNSWNTPPGITLSDADFITVDSTGISGARQSDGSLPDITFLKLTSTSDAIDVGIDVELPFYGYAPDLGYSEYVPEIFQNKNIYRNRKSIINNNKKLK